MIASETNLILKINKKNIFEVQCLFTGLFNIFKLWQHADYRPLTDRYFLPNTSVYASLQAWPNKTRDKGFRQPVRAQKKMVLCRYFQGSLHKQGWKCAVLGPKIYRSQFRIYLTYFLWISAVIKKRLMIHGTVILCTVSWGIL